MISRIYAYVTVIVVAIVYAVGLWWSGINPELGWLRYCSVAAFVLVALSWLWNTRIWRFAVFRKLRFVPPLVSGTWRGALESTWVDEASRASPPAKVVYLVVRQTFSAVSVVLLTDEARSETRLASMSKEDGKVSLNYMYVGEPGVHVEHRSRMHRGAASLLVSGSPATRLHGRYWTDRNSTGSLDLAEFSRRLVDDYESAAALFAQSLEEA